MQTQRVVAAVVYALLAMGGVMTTQWPTTPQGWVGVVVAGLTAGWGKYSSEQTWLYPNREPWSDAVRKIEGGK